MTLARALAMCALTLATSLDTSYLQPGALLTVPINKQGELYALLDFYENDSEYVIKTARQFCVDHGFGDEELRSIVEHTLGELAKIQTDGAPPVVPAGLAAEPTKGTQPVAPGHAGLLHTFMQTHQLNIADVLKATAVLVELR